MLKLSKADSVNYISIVLTGVFIPDGMRASLNSHIK